MPKERIASEVGPYHTKVGWSSGYVQVGVETEGERQLFNMLLGDKETLHAIGHAIVELDLDEGTYKIGEKVVEILNQVTGGGYAGVWADLDRQGCNNLIRTLRKARNAAHGGDE